MVFHLLTCVMPKGRTFSAFPRLERMREDVLSDSTVLNRLDLGAGQRSGPVRVGRLARRSAKPLEQAQLLFRLADHVQADTLLEVGTSVGLTALHLAAARPNARYLGLEGCPETAGYAQRLLHKVGFRNATVTTGDFEHTLLPALQSLQRLDFAFVDGNHTLEATLTYFDRLLPFCHDRTLLVFDDIHWSPEMKQAWKTLSQHPRVRVAIDTFDLGLIFFDPNLSRQTFQLRLS
jgi:predicted O-methyltransferase YrrM